jgi:protein O-mannosyl-transferase
MSVSRKANRVASKATVAKPVAASRPPVIWISLALAACTALLYARVGGHSFINYDDHQYITENAAVSSGMSMENVVWAFRSGYAANWHPVTWISHMLDCQIFGLNPGPQHLVNVFFHCANTVLLFFVLLRLTAFRWRSAMVAALFSFHPAHVESVAWIAERKDLLSASFWFLTMLAYERYARFPSLSRYTLVGICLVLGLMSKPMVVTLPCVLLLLDYWPLNRLRSPADLWRLFLEKIPLFALSAAASVVTFLVQKSGGAVVSIEGTSVFARVGSAMIAYLFYLWKTFWPRELFIPYWYDVTAGPLTLVAVGLVLALVTVVAMRAGLRHRYLPIGWFWFLGTLVPVIGLVQVGSQSAADRYTYIPSIGLFILAIWGIADLCRHWRIPRGVVAGSSVAVLLACALLTSRQLEYWKNSETLFRHTLAVDPPNIVAMNLLAWTYATDPDPKLRNGARAVELASLTVEITQRTDAPSLKALAAAYAESRQFEMAIRTAEEALDLPDARRQPNIVERLKADLGHYRAGRAIHAPATGVVLEGG